MKTVFLIIILPGLLMISCDKSAKVDILYTDIVPDVEIQSVDSYSYFDNGLKTCTIPSPLDSTITYQVDIDKNSQDDFIIKVAHVQESWSASHCQVYSYYISIEGLSDNNSIANSPKFFYANDPINDQVSWTNYLAIYLDNVYMYFDFDDCYIGVKVMDSYGWIKISKLSNNGIRIEEYAINKEAHAGILCGQKN